MFVHNYIILKLLFTIVLVFTMSFHRKKRTAHHHKMISLANFSKLFKQLLVFHQPLIKDLVLFFMSLILNQLYDLCDYINLNFNNNR